MGNAVLLNRFIGSVVEACQQYSEKSGVVAERQSGQMTVFSADLLADAAVVSGVYFIFTNFKLAFVDSHISEHCTFLSAGIQVCRHHSIIQIRIISPEVRCKV